MLTCILIKDNKVLIESNGHKIECDKLNSTVLGYMGIPLDEVYVALNTALEMDHNYMEFGSGHQKSFIFSKKV